MLHIYIFVYLVDDTLFNLLLARVAELADAQDSGSCVLFGHEGSSPSSRTSKQLLMPKRVFISGIESGV